MHSLRMAGDRLNIKMLSLGIPIIKIRRSHDRLIFNMGIPIQGPGFLIAFTWWSKATQW